jgi:hypothetical protein
VARGIRVSVRALAPRTAAGGDLRLALGVYQGLASDAAMEALRAALEAMRTQAVRGWPVGPERVPSRPHSKNTFEVTPVEFGTRKGWAITNPAFYLTHIHEKGRPERFVVDREINEPLATLLPQLRADLLRAYVDGYNRAKGR